MNPAVSDATAITQVRFAVVDVETSGLSTRRHRVLQVAVVTVDADGTIIDRWSSLVRPRHRWWFRLGPRHIHGLTRAQLRTAPSTDDVLGSDSFTRILWLATFSSASEESTSNWTNGSAGPSGTSSPVGG